MTLLQIILSAIERLQADKGHVIAVIPNPTRMAANTLMGEKMLNFTNDLPESKTKKRA